MSFVSYAQNFEDVMLRRALKHVEVGFYIDVGANDPQQDSVTKAFYEAGWRGINIEPVSQWFDKLEHERTRDINLKIAAGAQTGELLIYEFTNTGLSTMDRALAERHEERGYQKIERKVPVNTLTKICNELHTSPIHFLKIDVEGAEKQVLEGVDFSILRPWIVLIESVLPNTQIEDHADWEPILLNAGYEYCYFDGLNRFYIAQEHPELRDSFQTPPNIFDGFILSGQANSPFCNLVVDQAKHEAADASAANIRAKHLTVQLCEIDKALVERDGELGKQRALTQQLQAEMDHFRTVAEGLDQELHGLFSSKSWRITWPLRMVMKIFKRLISLLLKMIRWMRVLPKRIVKNFLRFAIRFVLKRPSLKAKSLRFLASFPKLKGRLRPLESKNGRLAHQIPLHIEKLEVNPDIPELTHHARRIYDDLQEAIAKHQKGDV